MSFLYGVSAVCGGLFVLSYALLILFCCGFKSELKRAYKALEEAWNDCNRLSRRCHELEDKYNKLIAWHEECKKYL